MSGNPPLGYDVCDRKLVVNPAETENVRLIYQRYLDVRCARLLAEDLKERGIVSKVRKSEDGSVRGGTPFNPSALYCILNNRAYLGETGHKGTYYPGQHAAILPIDLFDRVKKRLAELAPKVKVASRTAQTTLFGGLLFDDTGVEMVPSYTVKNGSIRYRCCPLLSRIPVLQLEGLQDDRRSLGWYSGSRPNDLPR